MSKTRAEALKKDIESSKRRGLGKYLYVDPSIMERLGIPQFKTVEGENFICVIPPEDEKRAPWFEIYIHTHVGADDHTFLCPLKMWKEKCPICEEYLRIKQENRDDERLAALWPKSRFLMFVVDVYDSEAEKKGVQWMDAAASIVDGIRSCSRIPGRDAEGKRIGEIIDIFDIDKGKNIIFTREPRPGGFANYVGFTTEDRKPIPDNWLEIPNFKDVLKVTDYETILAEFTGSSADEEGEEEVVEEEVRPARKSRRARGQEREEKEEQVEEKEASEEKVDRPSRNPRRERGGERSVDSDTSDRSSVSRRVQEKLDRIKKQKAAEKA